LVINNVSQKLFLAFLLLALTLTIFTIGWAAGPTSGRENQQDTTTKSQGDFNLQARCAEGQVTCGTTCVNLLTDSHNCGRCGVVCAKGKLCAGGICGGPAPAGIIKQVPSIFK
jgi:hypothetical protein